MLVTGLLVFVFALALAGMTLIAMGWSVGYPDRRICLSNIRIQLVHNEYGYGFFKSFDLADCS